MPVYLPPLSRRRFLGGSLAALTVGLLGRRLPGAETKSVDANRIAFFSDTHLDADPKTINRDVCMYDYFETARADLLAQGSLPTALIVNGDLALGTGRPGDYKTVATCLDPIRKAGIPVHMNLGNHDDRENFWKGLAPEQAKGAVEAKHVGLVSTKSAEFILLDSLELTNKTPGLIGEQQLKWLAAALDERAGKTCIVVVHHNPQDPKLSKTAGIQDTPELMEILLKRKQTKALIYGHTHKWLKNEVEGLHLINLPPVAYPFAKTDPTGWVDCALSDDGAKMTLHCTDTKHAANGQVFDLKWRPSK